MLYSSTVCCVCCLFDRKSVSIALIHAAQMLVNDCLTDGYFCVTQARHKQRRAHTGKGALSTHSRNLVICTQNAELALHTFYTGV